MRRAAGFLGALLMMAPGLAASAAADPAAPGKTVVQPAIDGLFEAFKTYPLVGLGDVHGLEVEAAFYADLIRDPRFAREVGNVVVEFGASGQQAIIDRYVAGESVPYVDLRKIWSDTVGWSPPAGIVGYAKFFAAVRAVNKSLPAARRIRVWLGEPPIDWPTATREQVMAAFNARETYPASLIASNILAKKKKALVIYGSQHFGSDTWLRGRVEAEHPGAFFVVHAYAGNHHPEACAPMLQQAMSLWPKVALASPAAGTAPEAALKQCAAVKSAANMPVVEGEGVLFLSPLGTQTVGAVFPDYVLDIALRREMVRRSQIGAVPLIRFPRDYMLVKSDYAFDLEAPGFAQQMQALFAEYDLSGDGQITADEYLDPIPR